MARRLLLIGVAAALASCAETGRPTAPSAEIARADPTGVTVYVVYNSFHSGLTVPTAALLAHPGPTADALRYLKPEPWTSLGYGDARFYEQRGINPARVLDFFRSMLAPGNPSVVHLEGVQDPLEDASRPRLLRLTIPEARFDDLERRVDASFALRDGRPEFLLRGQDPNDDFFRGRRPASVIHECNQWLGEVLGAAGVPHTPVLDTTSDGLALDLVASGHAVRVPDAVGSPPSPTRPPVRGGQGGL